MGEPRLGTEGGSKPVHRWSARLIDKPKRVIFREGETGNVPHKYEGNRNTKEGENPQHRGRPSGVQSCVHFVGKQLRGELVCGTSVRSRGLAYWESGTKNAMGKGLLSTVRSRTYSEKKVLTFE